MEPICAKAIRDGVIDAVLDHDGACMLSKQGHNVYTTTEPMYAFHKRTMFCMDVHNEAVRSMQYPDDAHRKGREDAERERKEREADEEAAVKEIEEMGDDEMDEDDE